MNTHKWTRLSIIFGLFAPILLQYQNCAPAPQLQEATGPRHIAPPSVIDQINTAGLAFVEKSVAVAPQDDSVALNGICAKEQSGATLRWELRGQEGGDFASGYARCDQGGFRVELPAVQELPCGPSYKLVALLGVDESDSVEIKRNCNQ